MVGGIVLENILFEGMSSYPTRTDPYNARKPHTDNL